MTALDLSRVRSAVVIAPHPDDEVIGAFGLICRLRAQGARVRVIVVTDGAASHRHSRRFPPARLAAARRIESRAGMALAGVGFADLCFLGRPDGGLGAYRAADRRALARDLGRGPAPDLLVLPALADNHPDHRTVARAGASLWRRCRQRLAYVVWPLAGQAAPPLRFQLKLSHRHRQMKRAALARHRTQTGLIDDDPEGFCMTRIQQAAFTRPVERFVAPV